MNASIRVPLQNRSREVQGLAVLCLGKIELGRRGPATMHVD